MKIFMILAMNFHGLPSEKTLRFNMMDYYGCPWTSMIVYEYPWKSATFTMNSHVFPSTFIDFHGQIQLGSSAPYLFIPCITPAMPFLPHTTCHAFCCHQHQFIILDDCSKPSWTPKHAIILLQCTVMSPFQAVSTLSWEPMSHPVSHGMHPHTPKGPTL